MPRLCGERVHDFVIPAEAGIQAFPLIGVSTDIPGFGGAPFYATGAGQLNGAVWVFNGTGTVFGESGWLINQVQITFNYTPTPHWSTGTWWALLFGSTSSSAPMSGWGPSFQSGTLKVIKCPK